MAAIVPIYYTVTYDDGGTASGTNGTDWTFDTTYDCTCSSNVLDELPQQLDELDVVINPQEDGYDISDSRVRISRAPQSRERFCKYRRPSRCRDPPAIADS